MVITEINEMCLGKVWACEWHMKNETWGCEATKQYVCPFSRNKANPIVCFHLKHFTQQNKDSDTQIDQICTNLEVNRLIKKEREKKKKAVWKPKQGKMNEIE